MSSEQQTIVTAINTGKNVKINAVAGSGKTTTILHIAQAFPKKRILVLTYNARLKDDGRKKVEALALSDVDVHSYHAFCVKHYHHSGFRDEQIIKFIRQKYVPKAPFEYDMIIIDEAQDITPLYYQLIRKIYHDNRVSSAQLCIIGDTRQCIYQFKKADARFLMLAENTFNWNQRGWITQTLSESFRITTPMAAFLNECLLNEQHITSKKAWEDKPRYLICNAFKDEPFYQIKRLLRQGYSAEDFFILAPSVSLNKKTPIIRLENKIKQELPEIPIYITSADEIVNPKLVQGKMVFSTFHAIKGLERKVVLIYNFDKSYFDYYAKDENPFQCPNTLYVACTRALEQLILIHHYKNDYLPCLNQTTLPTYTDVINLAYQSTSAQSSDSYLREYPVTEFLQYLDSIFLTEAVQKLAKTTHRKRGRKIPMHDMIRQQNGTWEGVSAINGTAIPLYYELMLTGKNQIIEFFYQVLEHHLAQIWQTGGKQMEKLHGHGIDLTNYTYQVYDPKKRQTVERHAYTDKYLEGLLKKPRIIQRLLHIDITNLHIHDCLFLANVIGSYQEQTYYKIYQIVKHTWMTEETVQQCMERLDQLEISADADFERGYEAKINDECRLYGFLDCVDHTNRKVYEFKCVSKLEPTHYLQLAIYGWLLSKHRNVEYQLYLYNILTDRLIEIAYDPTTFKDIIDAIYELKYQRNTVLSDKAFIQKYT